MSKRSFKNVDMDAAVKYMVEHGCKLDEAIEAVSGGLSDSVSDGEKATSVKSSKKVSDRKLIKEKTKLKAMRIKAGLSQSELAVKSGISLRTLQAYEQGYKTFDNARIDTLLKVALACECKLEDIIENEDYLDLLHKYNKS